MREKSTDQIIVEAITRGVEDAMRTVSGYHYYEEKDRMIESTRDYIIRIAMEHANALAVSYKRVTSFETEEMAQ